MSETTFGVGIPAPEPGYYPSVPMDAYLAWDACSRGRLFELRRSPAHLRSSVIDGSSETDALKFGSAAHMAILEPELFDVRYRAKERCAAFTAGGDGPRCNSTGKYLLASGDILCGTHYDGESPLDDVIQLIDAQDYAACGEMKKAVKRKRRAANLIGASGDFELSIVWDEVVEVLVDGELTKVTVRCKARYDHYSPDLDGGTIMDLKTAQDAEEAAFTRAIYRHGYHWQGAWYKRGAAALDLPARHYTILAMEKAPPYEVGVFRLTEGSMDAGEELLMRRLRQYAWCLQKNEWPGYPDKVRDVAVPDWAWRAMDDELQRLDGEEELWMK